MYVFHLFYLDIRVCLFALYSKREKTNRGKVISFGNSMKVWWESPVWTNEAMVGLVGFAFLSHTHTTLMKEWAKLAMKRIKIGRKRRGEILIRIYFPSCFFSLSLCPPGHVSLCHLKELIRSYLPCILFTCFCNGTRVHFWLYGLNT